DDELVAVSSPAATDVTLVGNPSLPGHTALRVIVPEEPVEESSASAEPTVTGTSGPSEPSDPPEPGTESSVTDPSAPADTGEESAAPPPGSENPPTLTDGPSDSEVTETPTPSALDEVGTMSIVLTGLVQDLAPGKNVPVTFVFANAGEITIQLPISPPNTARHDEPVHETESGH
ncbi:MAG TPA: hypothetical protein VHH15_06665, partial [Actinophytocola sp.]|nr:hypothetical protein [Actinophytocola sp.]